MLTKPEPPSGNSNPQPSSHLSLPGAACAPTGRPSTLSTVRRTSGNGQFCCDPSLAGAPTASSFCHFNISGLQLCAVTQEGSSWRQPVSAGVSCFILQSIRSQGQCPGRGPQDRGSGLGPTAPEVLPHHRTHVWYFVTLQLLTQILY